MSQTILVVEDEPASLRLISYFLHNQGYHILQARDGMEAMELVGQLRFDMVVSDLKMPRMDGVALARQLLSKIPTTPMLLMSGYAADDLEALLELGVPCLSKPLVLEQLQSKIQTVLSYASHTCVILLYAACI